jgi:hypothetical protein
MLEVHQRKGAMPVHPFSETSVITPTLNYITQGKQVVQDVSIKPMQVEKTARKTVQSKDTSVLGSQASPVGTCALGLDQPPDGPDQSHTTITFPSH